ncbi:amyloid-beta A4 precursor protein-binding family A member 1-like [Phalacrocorax aristotelis]|uniref:amyloid-beta A4 precursor protein-binding family A member 1-like n=1 Tax=Phalacrocorax aristotelis TaxID=126867 RepID=UPI003F4C624A
MLCQVHKKPGGEEAQLREQIQTGQRDIPYHALEGEFQPVTEVDLFISTQRTKVLNADTQETMMDYPLRTISYTADIGNIVVLMAHRQMLQSNSRDSVEASHPSQDGKRQYKMICHIFESEDVFFISH